MGHAFNYTIGDIYLYVLPNDLEFYNLKDISRRTNKEIAIYKVNDKDKYDPENKSKKAKPGKPAIYIEWHYKYLY